MNQERIKQAQKAYDEINAVVMEMDKALYQQYLYRRKAKRLEAKAIKMNKEYRIKFADVAHLEEVWRR